MALQIHYTEENGVDFAEAYCVIKKEANAYIVERELCIEVSIYASASYRNRDNQLSDKPYKTILIPITNGYIEQYFTEDVLKIEGNSMRTQVYKYLKEQAPLFLNAIDV